MQNEIHNIPISGSGKVFFSLLKSHSRPAQSEKVARRALLSGALFMVIWSEINRPPIPTLLLLQQSDPAMFLSPLLDL